MARTTTWHVRRQDDGNLRAESGNDTTLVSSEAVQGLMRALVNHTGPIELVVVITEVGEW